MASKTASKSIFELSETEIFKKMITVSLALHVSIFLFMGLKATFFPKQSINYESAIKVDLVALPDKLSEIPPPTPTAPAAKTPPLKAEPMKKTVVTKPIIKDQAISLRKKSLDRIKQFEKEEKQKSSIEKIQTEVRKEAAQERADKLKKLLVKGNAISPGTALKGLDRSEFNEYIGQLHSQVQEHWNLPEWLSNANLKASVAVFLDNSGKVVKRVIEQSSGDSRFDDYALKCIDDSSPFPAPPEKFKDIVHLDGIRFRFPQ